MKYEEYLETIPKDRVKVTNDGLNNHHIVPVFAGGSDDDCNRILLTFDEHFQAHELLIEKYSDTDFEESAWRALSQFYRLHKMNNHVNINKILTDIQISKCFEAYSMAAQFCKGKKNGMYGKTQSDEVKAKISKAHIDIPKSEKHRESIRKYSLNRFPEHQRKLNESNKGKKNGMYGKTQSDEAIAKMKASHERRRALGLKVKHIEKTCPHCNLTGKGPNMTRYHFDNCKLNPDRPSIRRS